MRDRKRIPDEVTSVPLADVPLREVARLVAIEFRTGPPNIYRMLEQSRDMDPELAQISFAHSRALMIEDALAGALLLKWNDGAPEILANVVAPEWRRGWVNALLLAETTQANVDRGMKRFFFDCFEDNKDTMGLATRGEAKRRKTQISYYYAVASAP